jgi:hypothetical protein
LASAVFGTEQGKAAICRTCNCSIGEEAVYLPSSALTRLRGVITEQRKRTYDGMSSHDRRNQQRTKPLPYWNWNASVSLIRKPKGARKLAAERRDGNHKDCALPQATPGGPHLAPNALAHMQQDGAGPQRLIRRPVPHIMAASTAASLLNTPQSQAAILAQAQQMAAQALVAQMPPALFLAGALGRTALGAVPPPAPPSLGLGVTGVSAPSPSTDLQAMALEIQRLQADEAKLASQLSQAAHQAAAASALVILKQNESSSAAAQGTFSRPSSPLNSSSTASVSSP